MSRQAIPLLDLFWAQPLSRSLPTTHLFEPTDDVGRIGKAYFLNMTMVCSVMASKMLSAKLTK